MNLQKANNRIGSYSKDKNGWVTFKGGKKKIKLRKFIADFAQRMIGWGVKYSDARDFLISYYEMDGVKGVVRAYGIAGAQRIDELKKQQEDVRKLNSDKVLEKKENAIGDTDRG